MVHESLNLIQHLVHDPDPFLADIERFNLDVLDVNYLWGVGAWQVLGRPTVTPGFIEADLQLFSSLNLNAGEVNALLSPDVGYAENMMFEGADRSNPVAHVPNAITIANVLLLLTVDYDQHPLVFWDGVSPIHGKRIPAFGPLWNIQHIRDQMYPLVSELTIGEHTFPAGRRRSVYSILMDPAIQSAIVDGRLHPLHAVRLCGCALYTYFGMLHPYINVPYARFSTAGNFDNLMHAWETMESEDYYKMVDDGGYSREFTGKYKTYPYYAKIVPYLRLILEAMSDYQLEKITSSGSVPQISYAESNNFYNFCFNWKK